MERVSNATNTSRLAGWVRLVGRWPLLVYRLRLGWLLGHRYLRLTHRGRSSGALRQTALLVVHYDRQRKEAIVVAGSARADWYRNIQATPALEVVIGRQHYEPDQRFVTPDELASALLWSRQHHPLQARIQSWLLGWPRLTSTAEFRSFALSLQGVALRPRDVPRAERPS